LGQSDPKAIEAKLVQSELEFRDVTVIAARPVFPVQRDRTETTAKALLVRKAKRETPARSGFKVFPVNAANAANAAKQVSKVRRVLAASPVLRAYEVATALMEVVARKAILVRSG